MCVGDVTYRRLSTLVFAASVLPYVVAGCFTFSYHSRRHKRPVSFVHVQTGAAFSALFPPSLGVSVDERLLVAILASDALTKARTSALETGLWSAAKAAALPRMLAATREQLAPTLAAGLLSRQLADHALPAAGLLISDLFGTHRFTEAGAYAAGVRDGRAGAVAASLLSRLGAGGATGYEVARSALLENRNTTELARKWRLGPAAGYTGSLAAMMPTNATGAAVALSGMSQDAASLL